MCQKLFCLFWNTFFNYQDYIVNNSQTIDCLPTMFLRVRSVTILEDPGTVSPVQRKGGTKVLKYGWESPWVPTLTKLFPKIQADTVSWLGTKNALYYCAQSAYSFYWILSVSSYTYLKTFVPPFLPTRLTAPGSPRMFRDSNQQFSRYQASAFTLAWKIVLSFSLSFFVMKAHVNNSYIRKIHKQRNINYEKYVRG